MLDAAAAVIGTGAKLWGANQDRKISEQNAERNIQLQREFAQNGISWKVEDAKRAGVHPLFALGANTTSFAPVTVGSNMAGAMDSMGQDISRAIQATSTSSQRATAVTAKMQELALTKAGLENELLATQIAKQKQSLGPPAPALVQPQMLDGQSASNITPQPGRIDDEALKRVYSHQNEPGREAGAVAEGGYLRTPSGWAPAKSKDAAERLEDDTIGNLVYAWRNYILPNFGANQNPPPQDPPKGMKWYFSRLTQQYVLVPDGGGYQPRKAYMTGRK